MRLLQRATQQQMAAVLMENIKTEGFYEKFGGNYKRVEASGDQSIPHIAVIDAETGKVVAQTNHDTCRGSQSFSVDGQDLKTLWKKTSLQLEKSDFDARI